MFREYIHEFIPAAKNAGITRLKFYIEEKKTRSVSVYQGELERMERAELAQMFIEGEYEGFSGSVFVEEFDVGRIPEQIRIIQESATYGKSAFSPYCLENLPQGISCEFEPAELETVIELMTETDRKSNQADARILPTGQCHLKESVYCYTLCDETETFASDYLSGGNFFISAIAQQEDELQSSARSVTFPGGKIPDMKLLGEAAAKEAVSFLGGSSFPTGEHPVVLESRVVCELLDAFMPTFFAQNTDNHMSILAGKLGQQVAGENITLVEDPGYEDGLRCRRFDDEGIITSRKEILSGGVLQCLLHNRYTAAKHDCISGGNGFKVSFNESVSTGYTNVVLQPGFASLQELAEKMQNGLLITSVNGVFAGAHPVSGEFSLISKGYRVQNGKLGRSVRQITIAGNFFSMLSEVVCIGNDERRMLMPHGAVCAPSLYVKSLMISGKGK